MAYDFVGDDDCLEKDEEIDIRGEKYEELIEVCFRYSAYFSFVFREKSIPVSGLERFLVASKITDRWPGTWSGGLHKLSLYSCDKITKSILQSHVNSLFSWVSCWGNGNPEDLAFYRRDKSVFFTRSHMKEWPRFWKDRRRISGRFCRRAAGKKSRRGISFFKGRGAGKG